MSGEDAIFKFFEQLQVAENEIYQLKQTVEYLMAKIDIQNKRIESLSEHLDMHMEFTKMMLIQPKRKKWWQF